MRKLILASGSPWRKIILEKAHIPFEVQLPEYNEDMSLDMPPEKLAHTLALGKARAVAVRHTDAVIVGADTFAVYKKQLIGKPLTKANATRILTKLSGQWNDVYTGIAVVDAKSGKSIAKTVHTRVHFRKITTSEIRAYVESGEPLYAGGSYTAQDTGATFIDRIEGDFWAVVGLPLATLVPLLAQFGIKR